MHAFLDELEGIEKGAGLGRMAIAAGQRLMSAPRAAGQKIMAMPGGMSKWVKKQPGEFVEAGKRMMSPIKSTKAGWRHMSPAKQVAHLKSTGAPKAKIREYTKGMGRHITDRPTKGAGRITRAAEAMSRRGWSGKGNLSKYVPLYSQKGMYAGFGGLSAKGVYDASKQKPTTTGEGGVAETGLGELLGTGAMIAGTGGLGLLPGMAMWYGGQQLGSKAGRIVDRLRGGADLDTAARAPSPQQAQGMLDSLEGQSPEEQQETIKTLQRYYG